MTIVLHNKLSRFRKLTKVTSQDSGNVLNSKIEKNGLNSNFPLIARVWKNRLTVIQRCPQLKLGVGFFK